MAQDISNTINKTVVSKIEDDSKDTTTSSTNETINNKNDNTEVLTDPIVCHDPSLKLEGIAKIYSNQNKAGMDEGELSADNMYDATRTDGILYPLVCINNRNVENFDIISLLIEYKDFLPTITLIIHDEHESEQKLNSSQMSGLIRVVMISPVDNVYKKILLNFKIINVKVNPNDPSIVKYYGEFNVPGFKQINMMHIWMESQCPKQITCQQGGHINANTWEMLHKIAEISGLGFAATKQCKEIDDRLIRNIYSQRFDQYIKQQLSHCGIDEENIFDAWVDLYGYIVMVNVPWVLNQDIKSSDLTIVANIGIHGTSNDTPDQTPQKAERTLSNHNLMPAISNLEIQSYNMVISNFSVEKGTLEHMYMYKFNVNKTILDETDIQTKQNSVDGEFLEDYNTGKNRPIPRFDFNDPKYTGQEGGYNLSNQKSIRTAFFRKHRQQILEVVLKNLNFGLQRGTLVNIAIFDNDPVNKKITFDNVANLLQANEDIEKAKIPLSPELSEEDLIINESTYLPNFKLSGLYYIDGMKFEYNQYTGKINQTLLLFKKGPTSGYENKHTMPKVPDSETIAKPTLQQSEPYILTN